jgi:hypothetical protein
MAGAPLDVIKVAAAALMLADHVNSALVDPPSLLVWRLGRIAFPLFCFVLSCHLVRGMSERSYAVRLLVLGTLTQPFFTAAFPWSPSQANILFTLAAGSALAAAVAARPAWVQHAVLGLGATVVFAWPSAARTGVDFGLAGILVPAAMTLVLLGSRAHAGGLAILVFGLNAFLHRPGAEGLWEGGALDAVYAALGSLAVVGFAATMKGWPSFLPRYAFYAFYPGHLLGLAAWRAWT